MWEATTNNLTRANYAIECRVTFEATTTHAPYPPTMRLPIADSDPAILEKLRIEILEPIVAKLHELMAEPIRL